MKKSTPEEAYGRAVAYGFFMTMAMFAPYVAQNVPFTFFCKTVSLVAGYAMVRETWNAQPRAFLICWLMAYSLVNLFFGYISGIANMGQMTERREVAFELLWINQSFELLGGGFLFICSIVLWIRALCQWKKPLYL